MRTINEETGNFRLGIRYPNEYLFTKTPYSYIKVEEPNGVADGNDEVSVEVSNVQDFLGNTVSATRSFYDGRAVFPIAELVECVAEGEGATTVYIRLRVDDTIINLGAFKAICGVSNRELVDFTEYAGKSLVSPPYYKKIAMYAHAPSRVYTGFVTPEGSPIARSVMLFGESVPVSMTGQAVTRIPHSYVGISEVAPTDKEGEAIFFYTYPAGTVKYSVKAFMDTCGEGLFVKWVDRHGLDMCYRFDVEKTTEKTIVDSEFREEFLDGDSMATRAQSLTSATKTYTCHSRMIDTDLAEMVKSIFTARDVAFWDADLSQWIPVTVAESEVEDDFSPMINIVVELNQEIDTMVW